MSLADPKANAARDAEHRREQAGTPEADQPLDPPFPYVVIKFDPTAFGTVGDKKSAN